MRDNQTRNQLPRRNNHILTQFFANRRSSCLVALFDTGKFALIGASAGLASRETLPRHLSPIRKSAGWSMPKPPFAGSQAVRAYLSRHTCCVASPNRRIIAFHETGMTFRCKDYRRDGPNAGKS